MPLGGGKAPRDRPRPKSCLHPCPQAALPTRPTLSLQTNSMLSDLFRGSMFLIQRKEGQGGCLQKQTVCSLTACLQAHKCPVRSISISLSQFYDLTTSQGCKARPGGRWEQFLTF